MWSHLCALLLLVVGIAATKPCRVLSLSGGGSYGAFEAGVLKRLVQANPDLDYDFITGVSAGSMNAGYLSLYPKGNLTGGIADLEQHWLQINSNRQIYKKIPFNILKDKSIYDTKPLRATVTNFVNGRSVQRPVVIGVTNIGSGTQEQLDERVVDQDLISTVMASSAIPVVFPPITLPNGELYSDGGTTANSIVLQGIDRCPANAPIELDIVVCDPTLSELTPTKTQDLGFIQLALRAAEIVYKSWNSNFLRFKCDSGQDSRVKARLFSPIGTDNGWSALDFTHAKEMIESGLLRPKVDSFDFCP